MATGWKLGLAGLAIAIVVFYWGTDRGARGPESTLLGPLPTSAADPATELRGTLVAEGRAAAASTGGDSNADKQLPRLRVHGRVVDARGSPIAAVRVSLASEDDPWSRNERAASVRGRFGQVDGFESVSDSHGAFSFAVPAPTSESIALYVSATRGHASSTRSLGADPFRAADTDLGDVALGDAGSIEGRVIDDRGWPISGARIVLARAHMVGPAPSTTTGTDGTFRLDGLREGRNAISASAREYRERTIEPIPVHIASSTRIEDITLSRRPLVRGVVLDEQGRPAIGARVEARNPPGSVRGNAIADGVGAFVLALVEDQEVELSTSIDGVLGACPSAAEAVRARAGDEDLVLRWIQMPAFTFHVVDAANGTAIESSALEVRVPRGGKQRVRTEPWPAIQPHPGGDAQIHRSPSNLVVGVVAEGFAPRELAVVPDSPDRAFQTVQLFRGGGLRGKLVGADAVLTGHSLFIQRGQSEISPREGAPFDVREFEGPRRAIDVDADGTFRIRDLATGTYRLSARARGTDTLVVEHVRVEAGIEQDVGELQLRAQALLRGRAVAGNGRSPVGLLVFVDATPDPLLEIDRVDGRFEIATLSPGEHVLSCDWPANPVSPVPSAKRPSARVRLVSGETTDVELDASATFPCHVTIRVIEGGKPRAGLPVWSIFEDGSRSEGGPLGVTDDQGLAFGICPGNARVRFVVHGDGTVLLGRSGEAVALDPGSDNEATISIESGRLALQFPDDFKLPHPGRFRLSLTTSDGREQYSIHRETADVTARPSMDPAWSDRRCDLGPLASGLYTVHLEVWCLEAESGAATPAREVAMRAPWQTTVRINTGETTTLRVPD